MDPDSESITAKIFRKKYTQNMENESSFAIAISTFFDHSILAFADKIWGGGHVLPLLHPPNYALGAKNHY